MNDVAFAEGLESSLENRESRARCGGGGMSTSITWREHSYEGGLAIEWRMGKRQQESVGMIAHQVDSILIIFSSGARPSLNNHNKVGAVWVPFHFSHLIQPVR